MSLLNCNSALVVLPPQDQTDRISELPDDILFNILSPLEMKDAAQTSIISKRWRNLWTSYWIDLDFDPSKIIPGFFSWSDRTLAIVDRYKTWVDQVLSVHSSPIIKKFRILCLSDSSDMDRWVKFAISKGVKELELNLSSCPDKRRYSLGFDILNYPGGGFGFSYLKSLDLVEVNVSGDLIEFIMSSCCHLERLSVEDSYDVSSLRVTSCKLKHLRIMLCNNLREVEIDALNLAKFEFEDGCETNLIFKRVPSLVEASFGGSYCKQACILSALVSCFYMQLSKLSLSLYWPWLWDWLEEEDAILCFPNVKHLEVIVDDCSCNRVYTREFIGIIQACPSLCEFQVKLLYSETTLPEEPRELADVDALLAGESLEISERLEPEERFYLNEPENQVENRLEQDLESLSITEHNGKANLELKVLKFIGFVGCKSDVWLALDMDYYVTSLKRIVCIPEDNVFVYWNENAMDVSRSRARKLAKLLKHRVEVVVL